MRCYYSRVPAAAVHALFDGFLYTRIPHEMPRGCDHVIEDFDRSRLVRFIEPASFIKNGEAYVLFAKRGDALPVPAALPFGVTCIHVADEGEVS